MSNFNVVQLVDAVTITGPQGPQGPQGAVGVQGATGAGVGVFEIDMVGDLMPAVETISEAFYVYDGNGDIMPAV